MIARLAFAGRATQARTRLAGAVVQTKRRARRPLCNELHGRIELPHCAREYATWWFLQGATSSYTSGTHAADPKEAATAANGRCYHEALQQLRRNVSCTAGGLSSSQATTTIDLFATTSSARRSARPCTSSHTSTAAVEGNGGNDEYEMGSRASDAAAFDG